MERFVFDFVERQTGMRVLRAHRPYDRSGVVFDIQNAFGGIITWYHLDDYMLRKLENEYQKRQMSTQTMTAQQLAYQGLSGQTGQQATYYNVPNDYAMNGNWNVQVMPNPYLTSTPKYKKCKKCDRQDCSGEIDSRGRCQYKSKKFAEKIRVLHQYRNKRVLK